jgi:hypothetical protein
VTAFVSLIAPRRSPSLLTIQAMKELKAENDTLKDRVAELEPLKQRVAELERLLTEMLTATGRR